MRTAQEDRSRTARAANTPTRRIVAAGLCLGVASVIGITTQSTSAAPSSNAAAISVPAVFVGVDPIRLLDTRSGFGADSAGPFIAGEARTMQVTGIESIPLTATSVAVNITLPRSATIDSGFVSIWPTGTERPNTSVNNATSGQAVPNFAISKLGESGAFDVYNDSGRTHIVIDVVGFYVPTADAPEGEGGALHTGIGKPTDDMGDNGDVYLEQQQAEMYEKEDDSWGAPFIELTVEGARPVVHPGEGAPSNTIGNDGDIYFDVAALEVYGPKSGGVWGAGQPVGPDGVGATFLTGSSAPTGTDGVDGDVYLDTVALDFYGPKSGGVWGAGQAVGPDGVGATFLTGTGIPDDSLGADGDVYLDTVALDFYGPKSGGVWDAGQAVGPDGVGASFLTGTGIPDDSLGIDGDVYLDTDTLELHGPKTGGTWTTSTPLDEGVDLLVGSGPPDGSLGSDGDVYLDQDTLELYGPKNGTWATSSDLNGPPTADTDSAYSASSSDISVTLGVLTSLPVPFEDDQVSIGTAITRVDDDTFQFEADGVYKITYSVSTATLVLLGDLEVEVAGIGVGPGSHLVSVELPAVSTILVEAIAGDSLEVVLDGVSVGGTLDTSIVIELVAVTP